VRLKSGNSTLNINNVKHSKQFREVIKLAIIFVRFSDLCLQSVRLFLNDISMVI